MSIDQEKLNANEKLYPKAIDLGLTVDWADRNLLANSPESYGEMFTWCGDHESDDIAYRPNEEVKFKDCVQIAMRDKWRMPTRENFNELIEKCECVNVTKNGVPGIEFSPKNKEEYGDVSIFLPARGSADSLEDCYNGKKVYGRDIINNKIECHYWISQNEGERPTIFKFTDNPSFNEIEWHRLCSVRPVLIKD